LALLIAVGGAVYISFSTSYTRQKGPYYTGESGDSLRSFRLDDVDSIARFAITPDGKRLNIVCRQHGQWVFCVKVNGADRDDTRRSFTERINLDPEISLSPDSSRVSIVCQHQSHWRDGVPRPVRLDSGAGGQWFVHIDRNIFGGFDSDFKPTVRFSFDSRRFGFPYKKLGQYYVQVVDTTFGPYDRADMAITKDDEIVLGYVKQDRAYIEKVYCPGWRDAPGP
jgi:hypothetical protein